MISSGNISTPYLSSSLNAYSQLKNIESFIIEIEKQIFSHFSNLIQSLFAQSKAEKFANSTDSEYKLLTTFYKEYKKLLNEGIEERAQNILELETLRSMKKDLWGDKIFWENEINEIEEYIKENENYNKESPIGL